MGYPQAKNLNLPITRCIKMNSKWIILNIKCQTINFFKKNRKRTDPGLSKEYFGTKNHNP